MTSTTQNTTIKVSLPKKLRDSAQAFAKDRNYSTTSGFIQDLIRTELARTQEKAALQKLIAQGIQSGKSTRTPRSFFTTLKRRHSL